MFALLRDTSLEELAVGAAEEQIPSDADGPRQCVPYGVEDAVHSERLG